MGEQGISQAGVIEKKVLIRASPETVFCALTSAEALEDWFCDQAASEAREGGQLQAQWRHGKHAQRGRAVYRRLETG
ncbi:MAG: SRPBCC domain-containing protein, partial [Acidobacteriota bacterium]